MDKIKVQGTDVSVVKVNGEDYICLIDMLRAKDGEFFITEWLRNRNTLEFIGIWEKVYNPHFNYGECAIIKSMSGLNSFKISVKEFVGRTNAISLQAKAGRYGGTYAHKDIAFEFAMWISPEFKVYIVKEFQRLKSEDQQLLGWTAKREQSLFGEPEMIPCEGCKTGNMHKHNGIYCLIKDWQKNETLTFVSMLKERK